MNRIDLTLQRLKKENKKAFITFVTAGDPDIQTTEQIIIGMLENGVDIVEIGVPFSDPVAEGPVIEAASNRSLDKGTTLEDIFSLVNRLREKTDAPLLLMLYMNTIFRYKMKNFFKKCKEVGIDGVIIPDVPIEESRELETDGDREGVHVIRLVAPTSGKRIKKIVKNSKGFLYCVSSLGVTGERGEFKTNFDEFIKSINNYLHAPIMLGFGIATKAHVRELKRYADGLIIGSAIVQKIEKYKEQSIPIVNAYVKQIRETLDE